MAVTSIKQQLINQLLATNNFQANLAEVTATIRALKLVPQYPIILVGGTNGKGSTCAYLTTILTNAGYKVGTYTSPHVFDYNERIMINNQPISDETLIMALQTVMDNSVVNLGVFKTFTLASHLTFIHQKIDIAIIEVGLGGAEDATNLFEPTISAITGVALDHCEKLGYTVEEIAQEKAPIFRRGKAALFGSQELPRAIVDYARKIEAQLLLAGQDFSIIKHPHGWDFRSTLGNYYSLPFPTLRGFEQLNNAALALMILLLLRSQFPLSLAQIKTGLLQTSLIGRFQVLPGTPQVVLDTAHNPQAVDIMLQNMLQLPFAKSNYALLGIAEDKDWQQIINLCQDRFDYWALAPLDSERSSDPLEVSRLLQNHGIPPTRISIYPDIRTAFRESYQKLIKEDRLMCFGSFLVVEAAYHAYHEVRK